MMTALVHDLQDVMTTALHSTQASKQQNTQTNRSNWSNKSKRLDLRGHICMYTHKHTHNTGLQKHTIQWSRCISTTPVHDRATCHRLAEHKQNAVVSHNRLSEQTNLLLRLQTALQLWHVLLHFLQLQPGIQQHTAPCTNKSKKKPRKTNRQSIFLFQHAASKAELFSQTTQKSWNNVRGQQTINGILAVCAQRLRWLNTSTETNRDFFECLTFRKNEWLID